MLSNQFFIFFTIYLERILEKFHILMEKSF